MQKDAKLREQFHTIQNLLSTWQFNRNEQISNCLTILKFPWNYYQKIETQNFGVATKQLTALLSFDYLDYVLCS